MPVTLHFGERLGIRHKKRAEIIVFTVSTEALSGMVFVPEQKLSDQCENSLNEW